MKIKTRKIVSVFCALSLFFTTSVAYADDSLEEVVTSQGVITNIDVGDPAPFSGVLLSNTAAAKLFGELKYFEEDCKLTVSKELEIASIRYNADISALKLRLDVETTRTESLLRIKDERIEFLEENWRPTPWYESGEFWLAVGVVSGILVTVAAGHAIGSASQ